MSVRECKAREVAGYIERNQAIPWLHQATNIRYKNRKRPHWMRGWTYEKLRPKAIITLGNFNIDKLSVGAPQTNGRYVSSALTYGHHNTNLWLEVVSKDTALPKNSQIVIPMDAELSKIVSQIDDAIVSQLTKYLDQL